MTDTTTGCAAIADGSHASVQSPMGPMGQFLYSVYVHSGPDYPGYKESSLFYGREVPGRVQVLHLPWSLKMHQSHNDQSQILNCDNYNSPSWLRIEVVARGREMQQDGEEL